MAGGRAKKSEEDGRQGSFLEWIVSGIGAALVVAIVAYLFYVEATSSKLPPVISVSVTSVQQTERDHVATFEAVNDSDATAANVRIEGTLRMDGRIVETAVANLDYLPGRSRRRGGLYFKEDPRDGTLTLQAKSYMVP